MHLLWKICVSTFDILFINGYYLTSIWLFIDISGFTRRYVCVKWWYLSIRPTEHQHRDAETIVLLESEQRKWRRRATNRRRREHIGRGRSGASSYGIATAMRRPGFAILESLSALAVEGCQKALFTDSAMYIRDNRIPGTLEERARGQRRAEDDTAPIRGKEKARPSKSLFIG